MKRWWIGYTGSTGEVVEVEVIGQRNPEASWGMSVVRLPDGIIEDVRSSDLHETEAGARRGRAMSEAEDLEGEARNWDLNAERCQDIADASLAQSREFKSKSAELRARAKALRDSVDAEVKDATEGRR